jgi:hypothetical protein
VNRWEKEVQQSLLDSEEAAIKELGKQYAAALKDINEKVKQFQADIDLLDEALSQDGLDDATRALLQSQKRSKVYQQQYQKALQGQVSGILDKLHGDNYATIEGYLKGCYDDGYIGTMYDIAKQGVPVIAPIDQAAAVKAILTDSKVSNGLYNALGVDVAKLKKTITQEISRGIASSLPYRDIARNIGNVSGAPLSRAKTIARTEGHRIQQMSTVDAQQAAKAKGADVVKQWDATLDGRTRDSHRRVDGEIRELDEKFSNGLMFPGDPNGSAAEVVNCRCTSNTRARWALGEEELQTLKDRAEFFGLDKTKNFEEFREKYLDVSKMAAEPEAGNDWSSTSPRRISASEIEEIKNYAKQRGINIVDLSEFDGDPHLLKAEINTLGQLRDSFGISSKLTVTTGGKMADADFAETVNNTIRFNTKALRNRQSTAENILNDKNFAATRIEDIAAHEFGHIISKRTGNIGIEISQAAYYNLFQEELTVDEVISYLKENVSLYSISYNPTKSASNANRFSKKFYSEIISEVLAKDNSNSSEFTAEFLRLLKERV